MAEPGTKLPSPQERLDLLLLGLGRQKSVKELCREAHVSRPLFYRWLERVRTASLKALASRQPGPKAKGAANPGAELKRLRRQVEKLERQKARLRKERNHLDLLFKTAERIIRRRGWAEPESKKNG